MANINQINNSSISEHQNVILAKTVAESSNNSSVSNSNYNSQSNLIKINELNICTKKHFIKLKSAEDEKMKRYIFVFSLLIVSIAQFTFASQNGELSNEILAC